MLFEEFVEQHRVHRLVAHCIRPALVVAGHQIMVYLLHLLFFFKQKTAYEIGLGIPAEPLFRSEKTESLSSSWKRFCLFVCRALSSIMVICMLTAIRLRSEERRVGKECRSRWSSYH